MVAILFFAALVSILDRGILSIVVDSVRKDLLLSDVQISLLQGLAFGLFYATVGLPLGSMADRHSRRWLLIAGVLVWSTGTALAGFSQSFTGFFVARILVGLGEAVLAPAAISMIADLFPPQRRGRPISLFMTGQALAGGLSISITSFLLASAAAGTFSEIPVLRALSPWRVTFICCGALGVIVVLALLTRREPDRRAVAGDTRSQADSSAALQFLSRNRAVFVPLYLAFALCFLAAYGSGAWVPTMLIRGFGASSSEIGAWLGPLQMLFSASGPLIGGALVDRFAGRNLPLMKFQVLCLAPLFAVPAAFAAFMPSLLPATALAASSILPISIIGTTMLASLQSMVPPQMRGLSIAMTGLVNTLLGSTLGPLLIAAVTERVLHDPARVGTAIALVVVPALLCGSGLFWISLRALQRQQRDGGEAAALTSGLQAAGS